MARPLRLRLVQATPLELGPLSQQVGVQEPGQLPVRPVRAMERLEIENWQLQVADLTSHLLLSELWWGLQQGRDAFIKHRWFTAKAAQRRITLKDFKSDSRRISNSTLRSYMSQSDTINTLFVLNSHFSNNMLTNRQNFLYTVKWKPNW